MKRKGKRCLVQFKLAKLAYVAIAKDEFDALAKVCKAFPLPRQAPGEPDEVVSIRVLQPVAEPEGRG